MSPWLRVNATWLSRGLATISLSRVSRHFVHLSTARLLFLYHITEVWYLGVILSHGFCFSGGLVLGKVMNMISRFLYLCSNSMPPWWVTVIGLWKSRSMYGYLGFIWWVWVDWRKLSWFSLLLLWKLVSWHVLSHSPWPPQNMSITLVALAFSWRRHCHKNDSLMSRVGIWSFKNF